MKYIIEGFNQEYALTFKKTVLDNRGKSKTIKLDCTDLVILRWFVDFYPSMKKITVDGKSYAWLNHKKILEDLPLLDISRQAIIDRMQKLVEFGILEYRLLKDGGTFSLYDFGKNYIGLVSKPDKGIGSTTYGSCGQLHTGVCSQLRDKDTSIIDTSIKDNNICPFFENLWELYPNKKGKNKVTKKALEKINAIGEARMIDAINKYKQSVRKTNSKFIKHGSTFFNGDYVDYLSDKTVIHESEVYEDDYGLHL